MARIRIGGVIVSNDDVPVYDYFGMENTSPDKVKRQLKAIEFEREDVTVEINSIGGDVAAGSEIYTALMDYPGFVTVHIVGHAYSAASVIAMAGRPTLMSPTAMMMIHNAWTIAEGDYRYMAHMSEVMKSVNVTVANAYRLKSGLEEGELLRMMDKETWLTPQAAKEYGLIDGIMFEEAAPAIAASGGGMIPREVINKVRDALKTEARFSMRKTQTQKNLMTLKGARKPNDL